MIVSIFLCYIYFKDSFLRTHFHLGLIYQRIKEYSGIGDFIFHNLRHTASTLMISGALGRGASLADVMKVLGHSKLDTTLRYVHADQTQMKKAMDSIPPIGYNALREKEEKRKASRQPMGKKAS